jgi:5S rRNA maturation endonuclease (ribonuclease M5)
MRCHYAVLDRTDSRKTIYLSTDGAGQVPLEFLRTLPNKSVIVAYDNDSPGNSMALQVMEQLPNGVRKLPKAIDWNEELKNMFNLSPLQQQERENEREQSRGFSL